MPPAQFRFDPLAFQNKIDYLKIVGNCRYSFARAVDEVFIDDKVNKGRAAGTIIIYDQDNCPIATFIGEIERKKFGKLPCSLNVISAFFGGLYISDKAWAQNEKLKNFLLLFVFPSYYAKKLKVDYIHLMLPPKVTIEYPEMISGLLPFYRCFVEVNSLLFTKLNEDLLSSFKYNTRYEIKKGIDSLREGEVLRDTDDILDHISRLNNSQASELKIQPKSADHFARIIRSQHFHSLIAVKDNQPVSMVVYTYWNGIATFNFNASTQIGKKLFINKALLFLAMKESSDRGAKYFVLGDGKEFFGNMINVAFFKKTFSTNEIINCQYIYPLSRIGHILVGIRQFRKNKLIRKTLIDDSNNRVINI
jgi:hypothetical protein